MPNSTLDLYDGHYIIYSDESGMNKSRYKAISGVTIDATKIQTLEKDFLTVLEHCGLREFKWNKLRDNRSQEVAERIIDMLFSEIKSSSMRVDTIIWDTHDSRHKIERRDDSANYERMYYHLIADISRKLKGCVPLHLRPDQKTDIDWSMTQEIIRTKGTQKKYKSTLFGILHHEGECSLRSLVQKDSKNTPLVQLADLLSGIAIYSRTHFESFIEHTSDQGLFDFPIINEQTKSDRYRIPVLDYLNRKCKQESLSVALISTKGLQTKRPSSPINFWLYKPQTISDKAPTK